MDISTYIFCTNCEYIWRKRISLSSTPLSLKRISCSTMNHYSKRRSSYTLYYSVNPLVRKTKISNAYLIKSHSVLHKLFQSNLIVISFLFLRLLSNIDKISWVIIILAWVSLWRTTALYRSEITLSKRAIMSVQLG